MKYPKEKIKSKCHHQGHYVSKVRRKPQKGAYGGKVKVPKIFDRIYDADDYAAECPVTCLLTPRDIEESYEENGFFDADEGKGDAK